jgi:hypothetical protein
MERARQRRIVDIDRGLFLVRYVAAEDEARPPTVKVSPEPVEDENVGLVLHPDQEEGVLWQPGTCLVIRSAAKSKVSIEVAAAQDNGSVAATVRMERLTQGEMPSGLFAIGEPVNLSYNLDDLRLIGHLASIGDVVVNANKWLAGPAAPSRIEGFSIEWSRKPEDVDICYSVKTGKPQTISGRTVNLGSFAGTRGKAMPVVGLMLELSGLGAANLQFNVEAIFLGSPAKRIRGPRIVLAGQTGREPLVGLRVGLEQVNGTAQPRPATSGTPSGRASSGVRVFRSRPKPGPSVAL